MRTAAIENAKSLGPILPVEPRGGVNEFGEAKLGADQVFATKTGASFHQGWCRILVDVDDPSRVIVIRRETVGARHLCRSLPRRRAPALSGSR